MEGPIPPRSKPLSCDALKSVIKSMSFEKRREIHINLPSLRTINSLLPYTVEFVEITPNYSLQINGKLWIFHKKPEQSNPDDVDPNQTTISIVDLDTVKRSPEFHVNKSCDEAYEKLFNVYLKNGSTIQELHLRGVPKFLCEREDPDGLKLNISRIFMSIEIVDEFDSFIRFVNLDNLEYIHLLIVNEDNEGGECFGMLEKPAIINCKSLDLFLIASETPPINYFTGLRNQTLLLYDNNFSVNDLRMLIENWKTSDRPIGTGFCLYSFETDANDMFNSLELQDTFPVEIQCDLTDKPGIGIKMDNNRDLVLYQGQHQIRSGHSPALKMEVIASGLTCIKLYFTTSYY
ncbi:hypothetical protein CRE_17376 [Caenorhabditis remanei]|uniref:F-box associated domain-containing protein n=1 Tax=Caenorhabditis remanei TaxID=31234 RepID=E3N203_CAERE|nr:hypothetical protein CRE_17376 [Caenorhabditis remanei]